jgi:hypothetical protein
MGRQADGQMGRQADGQAGRWADRQMGRQADGQTGRWGDRQMGRWGDRQMGRQAGGQTNRWADRKNFLIFFETTRHIQEKLIAQGILVCKKIHLSTTSGHKQGRWADKAGGLTRQVG